MTALKKPPSYCGSRREATDEVSPASPGTRGRPRAASHQSVLRSDDRDLPLENVRVVHEARREALHRIVRQVCAGAGAEATSEAQEKATKMLEAAGRHAKPRGAARAARGPARDVTPQGSWLRPSRALTGRCGNTTKRQHRQPRQADR